MTQHPSAAGFIIYKDEGIDDLYFLGLIALPHFQKKNNGIFI